MSNLPPEIVVVIEESPPVVGVVVSEVGLVGPKGPEGPPGPPGPPGSSASALLDEHINSELPHPVYDDGPSFELLYQNAKV